MRVLACSLVAVVALMSSVGPARADDRGAATPPATQAAPRVELTIDARPARGKRDARDRAWVQARLQGVVQRVIDTCYAPALARRPALAGTVTVRARVTRELALVPAGKGVTRMKAPGLAACVAAVVRAHQPPPPDVPASPRPLPGAYVDLPPPPARARLPLTVALVFRLAPPAATATVGAVDPGAAAGRTCGASPVGCKRTGCPAGMTCDVHARCTPSSCSCNTTTGAWICTEDCGGGVCVPTRGDQSHNPATTAPR